MAFDWLFGPRTREGSTAVGKMIVIRPLVLDIERIVELSDLLAQLYPDAQIQYTIRQVDGNVIREVDKASLTTLPPADRRGLSVNVRTEAQHDVLITFRRTDEPVITLGLGDESTLPNGRAIASLLLAGGVPRFAWGKLLALVPYLIFAAVLWAWAAVLSTQPVASALLIFGWLVIGIVLVLAIVASVWLARKFSRQILGHRIRTISRIDRQRNLFAIILAVIVGAIAYVGGLLTPN